MLADERQHTPRSSRRGATAALLLAVASVGCITDTDSESDTRAAERRLESLPYLTWVSAADPADRRGVVYHDTERSSPGLNLYSPRNLPRAILMDLEGKTVHTWTARIERGDTWQHVELLEGGQLLAIVSDRRLMKVAADSTVLWSLDLPFHHDAAISENGRIYALIREERTVEVNGRSTAILDDLIALVSPDGNLLESISLYDLFGDRVSEARWQRVRAWWKVPESVQEVARRRERGGIAIPHGSPPDILHSNTVEILPRDIPGFCRRGHLLVSIRELDLIAVVDFERRAVVWAWGPRVLRRQHQPTLLENDRVLIFDNKGAGDKSSRVLEVDPLTGEIAWSYAAESPQDFYSALRGGSQRLPNGNTLITESDRGRVFEVTQAGDIVWDFYVPFVRRKKKTRASIYRMTRLPLAVADLSWRNPKTVLAAS